MKVGKTIERTCDWSNWAGLRFESADKAINRGYKCVYRNRSFVHLSQMPKFGRERINTKASSILTLAGQRIESGQQTQMIGVLAYGSLITDPGAELEAVIVSRKDGILTPFAVEYARSSSGRKGAPTLVPVEQGGAPVLATILALDVSAEEAADIVYRREIDKIGTGRRYVEPINPTANTVIIDRFTDLEGFEVLLSTRIGANIEPLTPDNLAKLAIESAREAMLGKDGITYLMNAMRCGIVTPLTWAYEAAILVETRTNDLVAALDAIRRP